MGNFYISREGAMRQTSNAKSGVYPSRKHIAEDYTFEVRLLVFAALTPSHVPCVTFNISMLRDNYHSMQQHATEAKNKVFLCMSICCKAKYTKTQKNIYSHPIHTRIHTCTHSPMYIYIYRYLYIYRNKCMIYIGT